MRKKFDDYTITKGTKDKKDSIYNSLKMGTNNSMSSSI